MRYAIGIDLGGTNIAAGLVDEDYRLLAKDSVRTRAQRPWQEVVADMAALAEKLVRQSGLDPADCAGIGVGAPGSCRGGTGEVVYANNLHWDHVPLCQELTRLTGYPCRLSNDANCAALGEAVAGAAKDCRSVVLITLGTGVGSGIVMDGELLEGEDGAGAEFGHTTLISGGVRCTCGRPGCVESYVSATGLIRMGREAAEKHPESLLCKENLSAYDVYDAKNRGDETAKAVIAQYETYLGEALTNLVNLLRPEMILIGGGVSGQGEALTGPLNDYVRANCYGGETSYVTKVATASLGNLAGIIGASALCLRRPACAPLRLSPAFKDYLWGGERLKEDYGKKTDMSPLAESWELSCHPAGPSVIANGPWAGKTLTAYLEANPQHLRAGAEAGTEFPLLIKLIDAAQSLSVQVHPDDEYARTKENGQLGKTEMWYVVDAKPGAGIYYGFKRPTTLEEMEAAIRENTLTELLNWVEAKPGDVFFIPAGTVHAIGAGLLIAEVQQSSNLTYRVYDYGRVGADGKPRELHIAKALDVAKRERPETPVGPTEPAHDVPGGRLQPLVACDRFNVSELTVSGLMEENVTPESFVSLLCLEGEGVLLCGGESLALAKGQSVFLPAGMGACRLAGEMRLLRTTL